MQLLYSSTRWLKSTGKITALLMVTTAIAACSGSVHDGATVEENSSPEPILIENPRGDTCAEIVEHLAEEDRPEGYEYWVECKIEPVESGTVSEGLTFTTNDEICQQLLEGLTLDVDGDAQEFDWTSPVGIDAVFVKGGRDGNLYIYDPPATSDEGLHAPENCGRQNNRCGLSHISFCVTPRLNVEKDVTATFERENIWTVEKGVDPDEWDLFRGDDGTSNYNIDVFGEVVEHSYKVEGSITITNNTFAGAEITGVIDMVNGEMAEVSCPDPEDPEQNLDFDPYYVLAPGESLECTYVLDENLDGTEEENVVTVEVTVDSPIRSGSDTQEINYVAIPVGPDSVVVTDDKFDLADLLEEFEEGEDVICDMNGGANNENAEPLCRFSFPIVFACGEEDGDGYTHTNIATISDPENGVIDTSDPVTVTVRCYDLDVNKDEPQARFERIYLWQIDKEADPNAIEADGEDWPVDFTITVDLLDPAFLDRGHVVDGEDTIVIYNPHPTFYARILSVTDELTLPGEEDPLSVEVSCDHFDDEGDLVMEGVGFPYDLPSDHYLVCSYEQSFGLENPCPAPENAVAENQCVNEVIVELRNHSFDADGEATEILDNGTTEFSDDVSFYFDAEPAVVIDECVDVTDTVGGVNVDEFVEEFYENGEPPRVCVGDVPAVFEYTIVFNLEATQEACDEFGTRTNTATATPVDEGAPVTDDAEVECVGVGAPPEDFQTCTPGFWRGGHGAALWADVNEATFCGDDLTNPPFDHDTVFSDYFSATYPGFNLTGHAVESSTMWEIIGTGGGSEPIRRAARSFVAAYLSAACGAINYPYTQEELVELWNRAADPEDSYSFADLHDELAALEEDLDCPV